MTDAEILKAWEKVLATGDAPVGEHWGCSITTKLAKETFDMLNRQKAENAELQSELIITKNNFYNAKEKYDESIKIGQKMNQKLIDAYKKLQTAKSEARKEFAEKLRKTMTATSKTTSGYCKYIVTDDEIDNLLEEMEGGK